MNLDFLDYWLLLHHSAVFDHCLVLVGRLGELHPDGTAEALPLTGSGQHVWNSQYVLLILGRNSNFCLRLGPLMEVRVAHLAAVYLRGEPLRIKVVARLCLLSLSLLLWLLCLFDLFFFFLSA